MRPDEELVQRATEGRIAAIEELLTLCRPDVSRFAHSVCASPEDAEDATQETLWIITRRIGGLKSAAAFTSWAFQIVKNQCFRLLKHSQRQSHVGSLSDGLAQQESRFEATDVANAIALMDPQYRAVFLLRDVQGFSTPETSEKLGLSIPATKSRLHRARAELRIRLAE